MTANDPQFLMFALLSSSSFDSGQESTLTAEFFDQEQERLPHTLKHFQQEYLDLFGIGNLYFR